MTKLRVFSFKLSTGYTLVELLIIISITAILVVLGSSGYSKNQERQIALSAKELIISVLQEAQTQATIGEKDDDCDGVFQGIQVVLNASSITKTPLCETVNGNDKVITVPNVTFSGSYSITFLPLGNGVNIVGGSPLNIDYTVNYLGYRINVIAPGTIIYIGKT